MTDNEIIKALECCVIDNNCSKCPHYNNGKIETRECLEMSIKGSIDLINRLQAQVKKCEKVEHFADKTIATLQAEIKRLKAEVKFSDYLEYETTNQIKAEAYKEFTGKLHEELRIYGIKDKFNKAVFLNVVDKVKKELVGDSNA